MDAIQHHAASFARLDAERFAASRAAAWLGPKRREAIDRFAATGFPTPAIEEWKFTSVAAIARAPWDIAHLPARAVAEGEIAPYRIPGAVELVFVNGCFVSGLSLAPALPEGVRAVSLAAALEDDSGYVKSDWIEPHLGAIAAVAANPFVALNTALFADGALVYLPPNATLAAPIHLLFLGAGEGGQESAHLRNLIVAGSNSRATVIETYASRAGHPFFTTSVTEVVCGDGAVLDHLKLGLECAASTHVATIAVRQERASAYRSFAFTLGGGLVRNDLEVLQAATGTETDLTGLYVLAGTDHADHHTTIDHAHPHGTSRELYKGILDGQSHGVFNGKVKVRAGAIKTDSRQTNKNLLLSPDAVIDTKPELEILADDVKCSHGATIGQLDRDALFYLRSRGLDEGAARSLLTYAFASEVIDKVGIAPLRARLHDRLLLSLPGGASLKEIV